MLWPDFSSYPVTEVRNLRFQCSQPAVHDHPFHQVFVLTQGGGSHSLDGETVEIQAPIALVVPKGRSHLFLPSAQAEGWSIGFPDGRVPCGGTLFFANAFDCHGIPISSAKVAERLCDLARLLHENHLDPEAADAAVQTHLLAAFLQILEREHRRQQPRERTLSLADHLLTERFLRLLDQACRCRWEVARFARELRCSRRKLAAVCQQALGTSIHAALEERRMLEARTLLLRSADSVQQVAMELGYEDPSYFAKAFRRVVGETPSDYRNARAGQAGMARPDRNHLRPTV
jgi:AraC family transcriptional activator of pobA